MEPNEFDLQNEPQFDSPMDIEPDPLMDHNIEQEMDLPEQPPAEPVQTGKRKIDWKATSVAILFGLVVGIVYAWVINPIEWVDAGTQHLRADLQEDYVRMVIDSYSLNDNQDLAVYRLNELGLERSAELLALIANNPSSQDIERVQQLRSLVSRGVGGGQAPNAGSEGGQPAGAGSAGVFSPILLACTLIVVLGVVLAGVIYFRRRSRGNGPTTVMQAQALTREAPQTDYVAMGESAPISQWITTYLIGDDLFDDSFSIDTPVGEFMGECGVGIADTIGVGEPKRVSAFEIWLFDKNDIQTVTKVLLSEHAFSDDAIRDRLSAKGDPEMSLPGHEVILETETLQMVARVVDMTYGAGALPDNSFFERMTIELAIWQK
jgi:hypothetical protein